MSLAVRRLVGVLVPFASCISIEAYINYPSCILWPSPVRWCMRSAVGRRGAGAALLFSARLRNTIFRNPDRYPLLQFLTIISKILPSNTYTFRLQKQQIFFSKSLQTKGSVFEIKKKNGVKRVRDSSSNGVPPCWNLLDKGGTFEARREGWSVESKRLPLKGAHVGTRPSKKTCCFTSQLEPMRWFFASRNRKPDIGRLGPEMRTSFEFLFGEPILSDRIRGVESRWWWWVHRS